jgi:hypothetical protein
VTAGGTQDGNERGCTTHLFTPIAPLATFSLCQVTRTTQSQYVKEDESSQLELEHHTRVTIPLKKAGSRQSISLQLKRFMDT